MTDLSRKLEAALTDLGQARSAGVFRVPVGLPWREKAAAAPNAVSAPRWSHAWRYAVAACVVLALGGLWRVESRLTKVETVGQENTEVAMASREATELTAASRTAGLQHDYNGDGRLDGHDIQAFLLLQKAQRTKGASVNNDAADFTRQLLGS